MIVAAGCRMISADGLTVILISSTTSCSFSCPAKVRRPNGSSIPSKRSAIPGIFASAEETCSSSRLHARRNVPLRARDRLRAHKQNRIAHPWSRRAARSGARDQPSECSSPPKEYSGRKYLFRRSRSSIDALDSREAFGAKVLHGAPSVVLWKVFQLSRSVFSSFFAART